MTEQEINIMTPQQEIFQNMTKGEWKANGHYIETETGRILFEANVDVEETAAQTIINNKRALANVQAIVIMKRETIGKGINPESVERLKKALKNILAIVTDDNELLKEYPIDINEAEEALFASKLI